MFAHHGIARSKLSQYDRGPMIDRQRGSREATMQTKRPTHAPNTNANAPPIPVGMSSVIESPLLLLDRTRRRYAHNNLAIARPDQFHEHHALPLTERKLTLAYRNIYRGREHHGQNMRLRVAFAMPVTIFARHDTFELREHIGSHVGIPVLGNDHRGGRVCDEYVAQPAGRANFSQRVIDLVGDIDQLDAHLCLYFKIDHAIIFARRTGRWSNRKCLDAAIQVLDRQALVVAVKAGHFPLAENHGDEAVGRHALVADKA